MRGQEAPRRSGRGREDYPEVWEGLGAPHKGVGGVGRYALRFGRCQEAPPEVREG